VGFDDDDDDNKTFCNGDRLSAGFLSGSASSMSRRQRVGAIGQYGGVIPEIPGAMDAVKRRAFTRSFSGLLKGSSDTGKAIMKGLSVCPLVLVL
jgi:hypothetical protein